MKEVGEEWKDGSLSEKRERAYGMEGKYVNASERSWQLAFSWATACLDNCLEG